MIYAPSSCEYGALTNGDEADTIAKQQFLPLSKPSLPAPFGCAALAAVLLSYWLAVRRQPDVTVVKQ